jgi:2-methylcitrate dehydratase PrpD
VEVVLSEPARVAAATASLCDWAACAIREPLPAAVQRRAALVIADDLAAMTVASREPQVAAGQAIILRESGAPEASLFAAGRHKASRATIAAANGLAITWAELDEGFRFVPCHAGAYVLPALLAEAEATDATVSDVLRALAVGYEITARIALAFSFPGLTIHPHGGFNAIGAGVGLALLRGYDAGLLRTTLTAAATLVAAGPFNHAIDGALVRNVWTSLGATAGFRAADFAPLGIAGLDTALHDVFVGGFHCVCDPDRLDAGLGESWAIESGYHKLYACCQYTHASVQAALELAGRDAAKGRSITAIEVETHDKALALAGTAPETVLGAKFSLPHAMAAVAVLGTGGARGFEATTLADPAFAAMRDKVRLTRHPAIGDWPNDRPARVHWVFADGSRESAACDNARGGADQPFSEAELLQKFGELTGDILPGAPAVLAEIGTGAPATLAASWRACAARLPG